MTKEAEPSGGDVREQLAVVYRDHGTTFRRVAFAQLFGAGLQHEADDLVSTVIVEVLEKNPQGITNWVAYLVRIIQRRAVDLIRSKHVRHASASDINDDITPDPADPIDEVGNSIDLVDAIATATDALNRLDPELRKVAFECLWQQKKQADVAAELGITQARVSQMLAKARTIIQEAIGGRS